MKRAMQTLKGMVLTTVLFTVQSSFATASDADNWQSKVVDKVEQSIVHIQAGQSKGTGVVIDERGYIVTNNHVVGKNQTVVVRFSNGKELKGKVLWAAAAYDLAVVHVDAGTKLPAVEMVDIATVKRGHRVLAIGHPYGYDFSVSDGIVASLGRSIPLPTGGTLKNMIQITAPINPGNSGGALLNERGQLIGINTCVRTEAQNIAFAINANTVRNILNAQVNNLAGLRTVAVASGL